MTKPIAADLFDETADGPILVGGRSKRDGRIVFPLPGGAARSDFDRVTLGKRGRLWSWTVQRFPPKNPPYIEPNDPKTFVPFAVGYVELPDIIVETRLSVDDFSTLRIGCEMALALIPVTDAAGGEVRTTYAFRPVSSGRGEKQ